MLEKFEIPNTIDSDEYAKQLSFFETKISSLQREIIKEKVPVIIIFEGWNLAGKGSTISKLILNMDPRGYNVCDVFSKKISKDYPYLSNFFLRIPSVGKINIFDRSWYQSICSDAVKKDLSSEEFNKRMQNIKNFEAQLINDGYLIIKFFLHISSAEQKIRMERLEENPSTSWQIKKRHWKKHKKYMKYYKAYDKMLEETNTDASPWKIINSTDRNHTNNTVCNYVVERIQDAISSKQSNNIKNVEYFGLDSIKKLPTTTLSEVKLEDKIISTQDYNSRIITAQNRLWELQNILINRKIPLVIAFEGWDASGKGGSIKRLCASLDPRRYKVVPVGPPTDIEKRHNYLWRFWVNIPKYGYIRIFDRTWYGRVLVERVEQLCPENDWNRAYDEINLFEKFLYDEGTIVAKFWLQIDKDEQLKRFKEREKNAEKAWKITDEDWRNREKWEQYEIAVNDMLKKTNTEYAPWTIVEANNKKYARLRVLNQIIDIIESRLEL